MPTPMSGDEWRKAENAFQKSPKPTDPKEGDIKITSELPGTNFRHDWKNPKPKQELTPAARWIVAVVSLSILAPFVIVLWKWSLGL